MHGKSRVPKACLHCHLAGCKNCAPLNNARHSPRPPKRLAGLGTGERSQLLACIHAPLHNHIGFGRHCRPSLTSNRRQAGSAPTSSRSARNWSLSVLASSSSAFNSCRSDTVAADKPPPAAAHTTTRRQRRCRGEGVGVWRRPWASPLILPSICDSRASAAAACCNKACTTLASIPPLLLRPLGNRQAVWVRHCADHLWQWSGYKPGRIGGPQPPGPLNHTVPKTPQTAAAQ